METIKFKTIGDDPSMTKIVQLDPKKYRMFTGLFDRNGKEIYEGDIVFIIKDKFKDTSEKYGGSPDEVWIVEYGYFGDPHNLYVHNQINSGRQILINEVGVDGFVVDHPFFQSDGKEDHILEVIGNIYEHGHLLNNGASGKIDERE